MTATANPLIDATLALRDGRTLAYAEWGDPSGRPGILLHGSPGSRLLCPDLDATVAAGVRLLTIDRPGYGRSDPCPGRPLIGWADDFLQLAEHLDLPPCPIFGWSAGGPYALACAVAAADRVTRIGLAASVAPLRDFAAMWPTAPTGVALIEQLSSDREAALDWIREDCRWYAESWGAWTGVLSDDPTDPDARTVADPANRAALDAWFEEGARQGALGLIADSVTELDPWGFSLADLRRPVGVFWGDRDRLVGRTETDHLARTIPNAELVIYPGEGHLFPMARWAEMLSAAT